MSTDKGPSSELPEAFFSLFVNYILIILILMYAFEGLLLLIAIAPGFVHALLFRYLQFIPWYH